MLKSQALGVVQIIVCLFYFYSVNIIVTIPTLNHTDFHPTNTIFHINKEEKIVEDCFVCILMVLVISCIVCFIGVMVCSLSFLSVSHLTSVTVWSTHIISVIFSISMQSWEEDHSFSTTTLLTAGRFCRTLSVSQRILGSLSYFVWTLSN